ncbi:MAG: hypothetical protein Kow006_26790 [Gammaproteobacteria bacterium]
MSYRISAQGKSVISKPSTVFGWRLGHALVLLVGVVFISGCKEESWSANGGDPIVVDNQIAYVERPVQLDNQGDPVQPDARRLITFNPGANLYLQDRASGSSSRISITDRAFQPGELYDVRDVEVSYDADKLLFAMRGPFDPNANDDDQPTWNIWEYEVSTDTLRRIIASDNTAEDGHDLAPHYLPDGRIVFISTRQRQSGAILIDEGKPQFDALTENRNEEALVLHVMNDDGSNIHQISFNQSHDLDPTVLSGGRVMFTRWENMGSNNAMHLFTANPDGTDLQALYGANSHNTGTPGSTVQFLRAREMPDGRVIAVIRPYTQTDGGGDLVLIDVENYSDNLQPTWVNIGLGGNGQQSATGNNVLTTPNQPSPGGRYRDAFPLWDGTNRLLVSWTPCRLELNAAIVPCTPQNLADPAAQIADPLYGLWLYDMSANTQIPVVPPVEGREFTDIVVLQARASPTIIYDKQPGVDLDSDWISEGVGVLHIRSVYDVDGVDTAPPDIATLRDPALTTADQRPARFLRVVKAVSIPDDDVRDFDPSAFGVSTQQLMREIVAYAPIEPDGSVRIKVPANVPLALSVVDADGRRIGARHESWIQLIPGEERECSGCHDPASTMPHGRLDAAPPSANPGAPATGLPFPNTQAALWADFGESMAETRTRHSCTTDCAVLTPSVDLIYDDVWTDPAAAGRPADASTALRYADLSTPQPVSAACQTTWSSLCRTVINYPDHIHPLWSQSRTDTAMNDVTCTNCHNIVDAMGAAMVPAAQLDLSDGPSDINADHLKAYRELLSQDNRLDLVGGVLQEANPAVTVNPSMSVAGAAASSAFFSRFDAGGSHESYLTPAELRLIAEWLDIGAQYYNDPFVAPLN